MNEIKIILILGNLILGIKLGIFVIWMSSLFLQLANASFVCLYIIYNYLFIIIMNVEFVEF